MSATETATTDLPTAGTWYIEPAHSTAHFSARHLGLSKVRGRFEAVEGTLELADDPTRSQIDVTIDASSLSTNNEQRDGHLKSADFLEIDSYPTLTFTSTSISRDGDDEWTVVGDLTIHGVTKPVELDVEYLGTAQDPMGMGERIAFEGSTEIDRRDFGLTWEGPKEAGGILVGKRVEIDIDVQFVSNPPQ